MGLGLVVKGGRGRIGWRERMVMEGEGKGGRGKGRGRGRGREDALCEEIEMCGCERGYSTCYGSVHAEEDDDVVEVGFYFWTECRGLGLGF